MAKVKAVIFDMDGTVADTLASIAGFGNAALKAHGYPEIETERYRQLVGNGADVLMRRMLETAKAGQPYSEDEVQALRATYDALYESDPTRLVAPYPGIPALLRAVREAGVKTAVLSNKPDNMTCFIADALFPGLFDIVHGQRTGVPKKPDPAAVFEICDALGVQPAQCLYVGDSGVDMQTGANAGVPTAGVTWGFRGAAELRQNGADHLVDSAEALGRRGLTSLAAVPDAQAVPITAIPFDAGRWAVWIGNEGNGLTPEAVQACAKRVTIPMRGRAESFNASTAAAIVLWEMMRGAGEGA